MRNLNAPTFIFKICVEHADPTNSKTDSTTDGGTQNSRWSSELLSLETEDFVSITNAKILAIVIAHNTSLSIWGIVLRERSSKIEDKDASARSNSEFLKISVKMSLKIPAIENLEQ